MSCIVTACTYVLQLLDYNNCVDTVNGNPTLITDEGAMLTVCPGEVVSLTCSHDNTAGEQTRWTANGSACDCIVSHTSTKDTCDCFDITMISGNSGSTVSSTIQILVTEALNGTLIQCFAGGLSSSPQAGNTTLNVMGE